MHVETRITRPYLESRSLCNRNSSPGHGCPDLGLSRVFPATVATTVGLTLRTRSEKAVGEQQLSRVGGRSVAPDVDDM